MPSMPSSPIRMTGADEFVRRIISRSGIGRSSIRRDLQRELQAHLEDAAEAARSAGNDDSSIPRIVCERFGDPDEIAAALERLHRLDRRSAAVSGALLLLGVSIVAVAALIMALQLMIAFRLGIRAADAFPRLRAEVIAFVSLPLGYVGVYLWEGVFQTRSLWKAVAANCALFVCLSALASVLGLSGPGAGLAFVGGAGVRFLQGTALRKLWWVATIGPPAIMCLLAGRLLSEGNPVPIWLALPVRWAGLTLACYFLTLLSRHHELRHRHCIQD